MITTASGDASHAEGSGTTASGYASHAEGSLTQATGDYSHAEGANTTASGYASHAEGRATQATGDYSHAEGLNTTASSYSSHAEGYETQATSSYSHAEGWFTTASGGGSHAEGLNTTASGEESHAEGRDTTASGASSHAEGRFTQATGEYSHAEGNTTTSEHAGAHIMGQYGSSEEAYSWFIANGTDTVRALGAKWLASNGQMYIDGSSYNTGGADFAEMFETIDGKEIEVGYFVSLDGDKVKKATSTDYILGITSATPSIIGNSAGLSWHGRYQLDEWGRRTYQEVDVPEVKNKEGKEIIPAKKKIQPVMNPEWDGQREYVPREKRPEWVPVGLMGQVLVRDDGTCEVNGYCQSNQEGIATKATTGFRVIKRTGEHQVLVLIKPSDDENRTLKRDISVIEELQKQSAVTMQEYRIKIQTLEKENETISHEMQELKTQFASLMSKLDRDSF